MRYKLTDYEWAASSVPHANDRRVLTGIFWILRSEAPWRDLPDFFGPSPPAITDLFAGNGQGSGAGSSSFRQSGVVTHS
jgi:hypothetical protein